MPAYCFETSVGNITAIETDNCITQVFFGKSSSEDVSPLLIETQKQLDEYFSGKRQKFALPLTLLGTPFQQKVWQQLLTIPFGKTVSYQDIASKINNPKAAQAVGQAIHHNPIAIIIPCHRVIGKNGTLTGYAGGLNLKQKLLHLENSINKHF